MVMYLVAEAPRLMGKVVTLTLTKDQKALPVERQSLVKSGEYSGISLEIHDKPAIYEALRTYVDRRLKQKYRQDNNWSTGQKDQAAATARRVTQLAKLLLFCSLNTNVHSVEEKTCWILGKKYGFAELALIVEQCWSDDETIADSTDTGGSSSDDTNSDSDSDSDDMDIDGGTSRHQHGKRAKKGNQPNNSWRSSRMEAVMQKIDYHLSGNRTAIRKKDRKQSMGVHLEDSKESEIDVPKQLPTSEWLCDMPNLER
ncbi:hypothetical protein MJO28_015304 [Puccinia striiformis f. sp. tritici]|uniref:Uncharacterized protein n=1 Tax=Puccinia striiformis f. sp. tritici TaxID=168172 RepID=A0ACC0DTP4_9BASI|nr:hypothetical protein MJO28_015304 [Puccinia striiformis f. sp. tritici]